jgi:thiol:disulfide interchange protein
VIVLLAPAAFGTTLNPIQWTLSTDAAAVAPGKTVLLRLDAEVAPGLHVYYQLASRPSPVAAPEPSDGKPSLDPHFLLQAFGFGIASIFTPCVFPMVPLMVS